MSFANVLDANQKISTQFLPPEALGGVTQVVASTGITVGGTPTVPVISNSGLVSLSGKTGAAALTGGAGILITPDINPLVQGIDIANTGVLQLNGSTGNLNQRIAQYFKSAGTDQNLTSTNTDITFDEKQVWSIDDGAFITHVPGSANFTVLQPGIYTLEFNTVVSIGTATLTAGTNRNIGIDITRGSELNIITQTMTSAPSLSYGQSVSATVFLEENDIINCRIGAIFTGGPPQALAVAGFFDYNTTFTWKYFGFAA
jgi:hypothetical protein